MTAEEVLEMMADTDRLIWWIDFGRYQGTKEITIPKFKELTAKDLNTQT